MRDFESRSLYLIARSVMATAFGAVLLILILCSFRPKHDNELSIDLDSLYKNIRCMSCGGATVYDSQSDFAQEIREIVVSDANQGKNEQQIMQHLRDLYGDSITPHSVLPIKIMLSITAIIIIASIVIIYHRHKTCK